MEIDLYKIKAKEYFSHSRNDLISLIPSTKERILEIGAGGGDTLCQIKKSGLGRFVVGIELMELDGSNQKNPSIDAFHFGNIEVLEIPYPPNYFDVIICGDVLEHLVDPWVLIDKISKSLKPGGLLIASIPNIRIIKALVKIFIKGSFSYTSEGTFDKTHLRFFCKSDMMQLISSGGFNILSIKRNFDFGFVRSKLLNTLTFGIFEEFLAVQFIFVAELK